MNERILKHPISIFLLGCLAVILFIPAFYAFAIYFIWVIGRLTYEWIQNLNDR